MSVEMAFIFTLIAFVIIGGIPSSTRSTTSQATKPLPPRVRRIAKVGAKPWMIRNAPTHSPESPKHPNKHMLRIRGC